MSNEFAIISQTQIANFGEDITATIEGRVAGEKGSRTRESSTLRTLKALITATTTTNGANGKDNVEIAFLISGKAGYTPEQGKQVNIRKDSYKITEVVQVDYLGTPALYKVKATR